MVTKEQFEAYRKVQKSGKTNMFDVGRVIKLSKNFLTRDACFEIMATYSTLAEKYGQGN